MKKRIFLKKKMEDFLKSHFHPDKECNSSEDQIIFQHLSPLIYESAYQLVPGNVQDGPINKRSRECSFSQDGQCYMRTCQCHDEEYSSWFSSECQYCDLPISSIKTAWRLPYSRGGWIGCYCSYVCTRHEAEDIKTQILVEILKIYQSSEEEQDLITESFEVLPENVIFNEDPI
jgi:hypothetical protein